MAEMGDGVRGYQCEAKSCRSRRETPPHPRPYRHLALGVTAFATIG